MTKTMKLRKSYAKYKKVLNQGFSNGGTRTTSGTRELLRCYASSSALHAIYCSQGVEPFQITVRVQV